MANAGARIFVPMVQHRSREKSRKSRASTFASRAAVEPAPLGQYGTLIVACFTDTSRSTCAAVYEHLGEHPDRPATYALRVWQGDVEGLRETAAGDAEVAQRRPDIRTSLTGHLRSYSQVTDSGRLIAHSTHRNTVRPRHLFAIANRGTRPPKRGSSRD